MHKQKPATITYRLSWLFLRLAPLFMQLASTSQLVNLLADRELYPEFLTDRGAAPEMAQKIVEWLDEPEKVADIRRSLQEVLGQVAQPGGCDRAADFLVREVGSVRANRTAA